MWPLDQEDVNDIPDISTIYSFNIKYNLNIKDIKNFCL